MKKSVFIFLVLCCMFLGACSSQGYERDTSKGKIEKITLDEMSEKMASNDSFAVSFTQEGCGFCLDYHKMLNSYFKNHNVTMYEVYLTSENRSPNENLEIIHTYFPDFKSTPGVYYVDKGKLKSSLTGKNKEVTDKIFDAWVQENKLDEKIKK